MLAALAVVLFIVLIADPDRAQLGMVQVSQQPILDLLNKMGATAP